MSTSTRLRVNGLKLTEEIAYVKNSVRNFKVKINPMKLLIFFWIERKKGCEVRES